MKKIISYPIRADSPAWPGNPTYSYDQVTDIARGDSANTFMIHVFNHFGSHLDAPKHFNDAGLPISQVPLERFFYDRPLLLDLAKGAGEKITAADLIAHAREIAGCDLLMIRTGFGAMRAEEPKTYMENGPAVGADAARYLMEHFSQTLKAIALDFISLASYSDTADGDEAHRNMLGKYHDGYICIIEDVNLQGLSANQIRSAAAIPLFFEGVDSSPVTMWVEQS